MKRFLTFIVCILCAICIMFSFFKSCSVNNGGKSPRNISATKGGTINLYSVYPDTFNPLITKKWANSQVLTNVYEGLFKVNPDKTVSSVLATGYKFENGRYIVDLKKDVVFHNGKNFNANDVIYTLDLIKQYENNYSGIFEFINSYVAINDYQISIELNKPVLDFVVYLDFPILPKDYIDASEFFKEELIGMPVGTGPFILKNKISRNGMTLEKNQMWHGKEPYVDKLQVTFMKDNSTALYSFNACQTDIISSDIVNFGDFSFSNKMSTYEIVGEYYNYLAFNFENDALKNSEVRKAISYAVDKEKIVNDVMHSHAFAVNIPINPSAYYNPSEYESLYNEKTAIDLLSQNGWRDLNADNVMEKTIDGTLVNLKFTLLVREDDVESALMASLVKDNLKKCMIDVEIVLKPTEEYNEDLINKEFDMALVEYKIPKNGDLSEMLKTDGESNFYNISSYNLDESLNKLKTASNKEMQKDAFLNFANTFTNETVHIPLCFVSYAVYYQDYLKNFTYPSYNSIYNGISDIYIKY